MPSVPKNVYTTSTPRVRGVNKRQHVGRRTLIHGQRSARCATTTGRAAEQWRPSLVCVARCSEDTCSQQHSPSASSQSVPPGHPSFRRQRASRACESKCSFTLRVQIVVKRQERGVISTLLTSLGTSVDLKTIANHHSQHAMPGK